jgi:hypothetical protein
VGRESVQGDPRPGRPVEVTIQKMCPHIEDQVIQDKPIGVFTIVREYNTSEPSVLAILGVLEACFRWILRMLNPLQKRCRVLFSDEKSRLFIHLTAASRPALGPTQPPIQWVSEALSLGVKQPGSEADHSPPSSAEVKE